MDNLNDGTPYTVYTPYNGLWRAATKILRYDILPAPSEINTAEEISTMSIRHTSTMPPIVPFPAGQQEGKHRLCMYIKGEGSYIYEHIATQFIAISLVRHEQWLKT